MRKTEEQGFRYFACAENGARAKKRTVGVGEGNIHRPVILCSRTAQKRLLRRLVRKQTEQRVQISQALMTMMQNMVKK